MPRANPKAYFPGPLAKISYRKVDKTAQMWRKHRPYFDTWREAHDHMLAESEKDLKQAQAKLNHAINHHLKVIALKEPI
ncbi:hypothetical protein [Massilia sp.]|uniref:hypothetical protein n=1 Tax=Massilia sp. TaxID=1882437 RepID=UPI00352C9221